MLCTHCNTPNFHDYKFCRECGTKLDRPAQTPVGAPQAESLLEEAFKLLEQGQADQALASAQAALALDPESLSAHSALALVYERQGKIAEAIHQLEVVLERNPDSAADREKLAELRGSRSQARKRRFEFTPIQVAIACAVAAGVVTFGVGLTLAQKPGSGGSPAGNRPAVGTLQAAQALSVPLPTPPPSGTPHFTPVPPAPTTPLAVNRPGAPVATVPQPLPAPMPSTRLPAQPTGRLPQPNNDGAVGNGDRVRHGIPAGGLQPAAIGEVVPLPAEPVLPAAAGTAAAKAGEPQKGAAGPPVETASQETPRVEPFNTEAGFIKIEAAKRPANPEPVQNTNTSTAPAPGTGNRPSISVSITPSGQGGRR